MDVPIDEPPGLQLIQQVVEAGETLVGQIVAVVQAPGGGVGQQHVDAPHPAHLGPQPCDAPAHGALGVLVGALAVVADRAAQAHDPQALPVVDPVVHADAAARLMLGVIVVVVAVDVEDGRGGEVGQIFQVGAGQVPAGQDQVYAIQPLPALG